MNNPRLRKQMKLIEEKDRIDFRYWGGHTDEIKPDCDYILEKYHEFNLESYDRTSEVKTEGGRQFSMFGGFYVPKILVRKNETKESGLEAVTEGIMSSDRSLPNIIIRELEERDWEIIREERGRK